MRQSIIIAAAGVIAAAALVATAARAGKENHLSADANAPATIYDFVVKDINGQDYKMDQLRGKVLLIVNVASRCGYTPQYEGLQALYEKYQSRDFVVLGFPANNFGGQEPGTNEEIKTFCSTKYKVTFPLFSKISVKGDDKHPLYKYLTEKQTDARLNGEISWNFNKFLVNRTGEIVARFDSKDAPEGEKVTKAVEQALAAK